MKIQIERDFTVERAMIEEGKIVTGTYHNRMEEHIVCEFCGRTEFHLYDEEDECLECNKYVPSSDVLQLIEGNTFVAQIDSIVWELESLTQVIPIWDKFIDLPVNLFKLGETKPSDIGLIGINTTSFQAKGHEYCAVINFDDYNWTEFRVVITEGNTISIRQKKSCYQVVVGTYRPKYAYKQLELPLHENITEIHLSDFYYYGYD